CARADYGSSFGAYW
nr:immunoglobulin heavy chain junction region [Mus musculus]